MKFRDAEQRARVCRALLTTTMDKWRADTMWNRRGPTNLAIALAREGFHGELDGTAHRNAWMSSLRLAWDVWNDGGNFKISDALQHWTGSNAWVVLPGFGWRKVDQDGER